MLSDMKRRAAERGADTETLTQLQKLAVEDVIKGLDINPVSLQLAASQLTAGNHRVSYRRMGLHQMLYGPHQYEPKLVSVGSLELLGQNAIIPRNNELDIDEEIASQFTWRPSDDNEMEDAVDSVKDARIVIMNPPFTNRINMGQKFPKETQKRMRSRADTMEKFLLEADPGLIGFSDKNSIGPLFVALADHVQKRPDGVVSMINPTIALSSTSGLKERQILAQRFHIHTVVTCHQPGNINMSQNTSINESIVIMRRHADGSKPSTRFVHLDKMPVDENEVTDLHRSLGECPRGQMSNGWGEVSHWPTERMEEGDWAPAIWRSPKLAQAATRFANEDCLQTMQRVGLSAKRTDELVRSAFEPPEPGAEGSFPILKSKGADGQTRIESQPDEHWVPKQDKSIYLSNGAAEPKADNLLEKAALLLVTDGQRNNTARLTAVASDSKYVGVSWMSVTGLVRQEAKAVAVFLNSTVGRLQIMSNGGRTLEFPLYRPASYRFVRIPDIKDARIRGILADCWERTKDMVVPQFRDGECEVRRLWDEAVAEAMGWDSEGELTRLRLLLHQEPHVRGLGYGQYADEAPGDLFEIVTQGVEVGSCDGDA